MPPAVETWQPSRRRSNRNSLWLRIEGGGRPSFRGKPASELKGSGLVEQGGELLDHRPAKLLGIHDRDRPAIITGDVVTDADGDQFDRRAALDPADHLPKVTLEIGAAV